MAGAYQYESVGFLVRCSFLLPDPSQAEIVAVYRLAIQRMFVVTIADLCLFGMDIVFCVDLGMGWGGGEGEGEGEMRSGDLKVDSYRKWSTTTIGM